MLWRRSDLFRVVPGPRSQRGPGRTCCMVDPAGRRSVERTQAVDQKVTEDAIRYPAVRRLDRRSPASICSPAPEDQLRGDLVRHARGLVMSAGPGRHARDRRARRSRRERQHYQGRVVLAFEPPPIQGLSTTGGFEGYVQDRAAGTTRRSSQAATQRLLRPQRSGRSCGDVQTTFSASVPQMRIELDREKAKALGIPVTDIFDHCRARSAPVRERLHAGRTLSASTCSRKRNSARAGDLATSMCVRRTATGAADGA